MEYKRQRNELDLIWKLLQTYSFTIDFNKSCQHLKSDECVGESAVCSPHSLFTPRLLQPPRAVLRRANMPQKHSQPTQGWRSERLVSYRAWFLTAGKVTVLCSELCALRGHPNLFSLSCQVTNFWTKARVFPRCFQIQKNTRRVRKSVLYCLTWQQYLISC